MIKYIGRMVNFKNKGMLLILLIVTGTIGFFSLTAALCCAACSVMTCMITSIDCKENQIDSKRHDGGIKSGYVMIYCLLVSAIIMAICSRCSFFYPFNEWVDSNCFFTVGKAMFNGKVVYRDIYEQKGVLLYFIHGLAYLISNDTFIGVYIFETIIFAWFLYIAYKTEIIFIDKKIALLSLPVISFLLLSSNSFWLGDSAEELCLPLLMLPIYYYCNWFLSKNEKKPKLLELFLLGAAAGCILWIKFAMLGLYIGFILALIIILSCRKQFRHAIMCCICLGAGVVTASIPWLIYFGVNGALKDMFYVYFYNNIFIYSSDASLVMRILSVIWAFCRACYYNLQWSVLAIIGIILICFSKTERKKKIGLLLICGLHILFTYISGRDYPYYAFGFGMFAVIGIAQAVMFIRDKFGGKKFWVSANSIVKSGTVFASIIVLIASGAFSYLLSDNTFMFNHEREDLWQYKFAEIISRVDDATVLNYGSLDMGIYTVCDKVPDFKYFCRLNINLDEMYKEQDRYIKEKKPDFVVMKFEGNVNIDSNITQNYEVVSQIKSWYEYKDRYATYCLLKAKMF